MNNRFFPRQIFALLALTTFGALAACSTIEGAGQDMQRAGAAVSNEAREAESGM